MAVLADRAEALVEKWTERSLTGIELLGGPTTISFEEAAAALRMPEHVLGAIAQDLFFSGEGSYFDERAMQYGVADLIQVIRKAPASLTE